MSIIEFIIGLFLGGFLGFFGAIADRNPMPAMSPAYDWVEEQTFFTAQALARVGGDHRVAHYGISSEAEMDRRFGARGTLFEVIALDQPGRPVALQWRANPVTGEVYWVRNNHPLTNAQWLDAVDRKYGGPR